MKIPVMPVYKCHKCGHEWIPRIQGKFPRLCPACRKRDWQEEP